MSHARWQMYSETGGGVGLHSETGGRMFFLCGSCSRRLSSTTSKTQQGTKGQNRYDVRRMLITYVADAVLLLLLLLGLHNETGGRMVFLLRTSCPVRPLRCGHKAQLGIQGLGVTDVTPDGCVLSNANVCCCCCCCCRGDDPCTAAAALAAEKVLGAR